MKQTVEEAVIEHCNGYFPNPESADRYMLGKRAGYIRGFKQGAEWQTKQSPWISVEERLPEIGQVVLIVHEYRGDVIIDTATFDGKYFHGEGLIFEKTEILCWLPIPSFYDILEANKDVLQ